MRIQSLILTWALLLVPILIFSQDISDLSYYTDSIQENTSDTLNKSQVEVYLGMSIIPASSRFTYELSYTSNIEIDLDLFFTRKSGLRTGLRYTKSTISYDLSYLIRDTSGHYIRKYDGNIIGQIQSVGLPIKYIYTGQKKLDFYFETGVVIYLLNYLSANESLPQLDIYRDIERKGFDLRWDFEASLGLNMKIKDKSNVKLGLAGGFAPGNNTMTYLYYVGFHIGATFHLGN